MTRERRRLVLVRRPEQGNNGGSHCCREVHRPRVVRYARLLDPEKRSLAAKIKQAFRAFQLELALSKDEILALYLARAPYGGNLEGVRAASLAYFGKEPRKLSLAEAALLVALPQSPELR